MKNIHVLPTDKPSRIYLIKSNSKLDITSNNPEFTENFGGGTQNQHIYITSDEEIKKGDWGWHHKDKISQAFGKIILTTDQKLIKDGIQPIDDEFLEWFVKNQSCEEVEVIKEDVEQPKPLYPNGNHKGERVWIETYKIIIPKEETFEEAEITFANEIQQISDYDKGRWYGRIEGAKWQQERMYSEEDMRQSIFTSFLLGVDRGNYSKELEDKLIEQYKKK